MKPEHKNILKKIVLYSTILIITLGIGLTVKSILAKNKNSNPSIEKTSTKQQESNNKSAKDTKDLNIKKYKGNFNLYRADDDKKELIASIKMYFDIENPEITRWDNYLIYGTGVFVMEPRIYIHDINKGTTEELINSSSLSQHFSEKKAKEEGLALTSPPTLVGDTLFFSFGEYLQEGGGYWMDLNKEDRKPIYYKKEGTVVHKIGDQWWVIDSDGDGPWYVLTYDLLDPKSKIILRTFKFHNMSEDSMDLLFVDSGRNRLIVRKYKDVAQEDSVNTKPSNKPYDISILEINYLNSQETTLLSNEQIPLDQFEMTINEGRKAIYFYNDTEIYLFDTISNKLKHLGEYKGIQYTYPMDNRSDAVCLRLKDGENFHYKQIPVYLSMNTALNDKECEEVLNPTYLEIKENLKAETYAKALFDSLSLPSNYSYYID
jgi:hypothetical protein